MTADLRAALRDTATAWDALGMRAAQPECDSHPLVNPDHCAARARQLRALADAPPTVAERMPVTWIDAHRSDGYLLACITIAGITIDVIGSPQRCVGPWLWSWRADVGAIGSGTAPDEASAKAAALAALDEWIAEIVDARRAVTL